MGGMKPGKRLKRSVHSAMCSKPDRDVSGLVCGFPLPCPHHTVVVDATCKRLKRRHRITIPRSSCSQNVVVDVFIKGLQAHGREITYHLAPGEGPVEITIKIEKVEK